MVKDFQVFTHAMKFLLTYTLCVQACAHVSFLLCHVYKNLTCLLSATEAPCLPAPPLPPPEWRTYPVTKRGRWVEGGRGGMRRKEKEKWWEVQGRDDGGVVGGGSEASSNVPSPLPCLWPQSSWQPESAEACRCPNAAATHTPAHEHVLRSRAHTNTHGCRCPALAACIVSFLTPSSPRSRLCQYQLKSKCASWCLCLN